MEDNKNFVKASTNPPKYELLTIEEIVAILHKLDDILFQYARHAKIHELQKQNRKEYSQDEISELLKSFDEELTKFNMVQVDNALFTNNNNTPRVTLAQCLENPIIIQNKTAREILLDFLFDDKIKISDIRKLHVLAAFMEKMNAHQFVAILENGLPLNLFYVLQEDDPHTFDTLLNMLTSAKVLVLVKEWYEDNKDDIEENGAKFDSSDLTHIISLLNLEEEQNIHKGNTSRRNSSDIIESLGGISHNHSDEETNSNNCSGEDDSEPNYSGPEAIDFKINGGDSEISYQPTSFNSNS